MWTSAPLASQQGTPVPVLFSGPCSQLRVGFGPLRPHKTLGLRCEQHGVSSSRHEDGFWCGQAAHRSPSDSDHLHTGPGAPGQLSSLPTNPGGCGHHCRPPPHHLQDSPNSRLQDKSILFFMVTINRSSLKPITRLGERQCPTVGEDDGLACSIRSKRTSKHHRDLSITTYREHVPLLLFMVQGKHPRNGRRKGSLRTLPENLQCHYQQGEPTVLHSA